MKYLKVFPFALCVLIILKEINILEDFNSYISNTIKIVTVLYFLATLIPALNIIFSKDRLDTDNLSSETMAKLKVNSVWLLSLIFICGVCGNWLLIPVYFIIMFCIWYIIVAKDNKENL